MTLQYQLDNGGGTTWTMFGNTASVHTTFPTAFATYTNLAAGSHTWKVSNVSLTNSDGNDHYWMLAVELAAS
jgi:hypothetical protein